jgi:gamma-glutamyltranspeptidase/glutathione hydrolase
MMTKALDFTSGYASRRPPMMGHNAVATSQPLAAQAGMKMLQLGGMPLMRPLPPRWR